jgi:hypothetical protein
MPITVVSALEFALEPGIHSATLIKASLKTKLGRGGAYTAFQITFADPNGGEASAMLPEFLHKIPVAFAALGSPIGTRLEITPERLLALRGRNAKITVVHRNYQGRQYANVTAIDGVVIA